MDRKHLLQGPAGAHWARIGLSDRHGIAIPLSALRGSQGGGIGEYRDLIPLIDWCAEVGFSVIQLLPLYDSGSDPSPYSALSAFALNPLYLSLGGDPKLNHLNAIDYAAVRDQKLAALADVTGSLKREWLVPYALFKTLRKKYARKAWWDWPVGPDPKLQQEYEREIHHHAGLQALCEQELRAVRAHADSKGVLLMGDIPILLSPNSADVWWYPQYFGRTESVGAPPDQYSALGQNWGFPTYRWDALEADQFRWWRQRLQQQEAFFHLYRLDHIVGFFRFWQIPRGQKGTEGRFVPEALSDALKQGRQLLSVMLESSSMLPIGEDLGAVPVQVREIMADLGICGTKVMRWEREWEGDQHFLPSGDYPDLSLTCVSTHDSEPLSLWWSSHPDEAKLYAKDCGLTWEPTLALELRRDILTASHHSGSLFHINPIQEYLALVPELTRSDPNAERINIPGTTVKQNWTYRLLPSIEEFVHNAELKEAIREILP